MSMTFKRNLGFRPERRDEQRPVALRLWLWRSYLRAALIPLLVIEVTFLAIYWASTAIVYRENVAAVRAVSGDYLDDVARREATSIGNVLAGVGVTTTVFARQALAALEGNYEPPESEKRRYERNRAGQFYTRYDNGTTASFYTGYTPAGPSQISKVWRLAALDPLMMDLKNSDPHIASLYVNTYDSYNRIFPYFDVMEQYPPKIDIREFNFYYEADEAHNPQRRQIWTNAYVDPAGHGWMVSSIAPMWSGQRLEGVVGIDVTLQTIIDRLLALRLPWKGYALLVDREGQIIALPPLGEADFRLKELTAKPSNQADLGNTAKPAAFNINNRSDTRVLAQAMAASSEGQVELMFDGPHLASFSTVPGPGWRLVVIAPSREIFSNAEALRERTEGVGYIMLIGLVIFYIVFLLLLSRRARSMSVRVAEPVGKITELIHRIGRGEYRQLFNGSQITELDQLGHAMVATGNQLGDAHDRIVEQDRVLSKALAGQWQLYDEQVRFIRTMSHELRTPLAVIDSGAQIIDRKANNIVPADLRRRASRLRGAVRQISDLLHRLVSSTQTERHFTATQVVPARILQIVEEVSRETVPVDRLRLELGTADAVTNDTMPLTVALSAALDNAVRYAPGEIVVSVNLSENQAIVTVADKGTGLPEDQLAQMGKRYYRGPEAIGVAGAGLGINLARAILENVGGAFTVSSGASGTTVRILIPLADADPAEERSVKPPRILCIEDEPALREDLVHELREAGYDVVEAEDGPAGLAIIRNGEVSLIYCDVQLPRMTGLDLLQTLRESPDEYGSVPVVLLTAYGDSQMKQRAMELGVRDLLVKPVDYEVLLGLTAKLVGEAR